MSEPQPTPRARGGFHIPKIVWDLVFTLAIPVALLSPSLLGRDARGEGIGFSDLFGTVTTYVIAALVPAAYILIDTLRTRKLNPVTILAAGSALIGGALAFLRIEGAAFALKDSYHSVVLALVMGVSLLAGRPFFAVFVRVALLEDSPERRALVDRMLAAPAVRAALRAATAIILFEALAMGTANFAVNYNTVRDHFGTKTFNAQVAQANAIMRFPSLITSLAAFAVAFLVVQRGLTRAFGPKAQLFEDDLWDAIEAAGRRDEPAENPAPLESRGA